MRATIALNRVRDVHAAYRAYTGPDNTTEARRLDKRLGVVHQTFGRSKITDLADLLAKLEYIDFLDAFIDLEAEQAFKDAVAHVRGMMGNNHA